jgi:hypothetical protein
MRMTQKSACSPPRAPRSTFHRAAFSHRLDPQRTVWVNVCSDSRWAGRVSLGERLFQQAVGGAGEMVFASDKTLR